MLSMFIYYFLQLPAAMEHAWLCNSLIIQSNRSLTSLPANTRTSLGDRRGTSTQSISPSNHPSPTKVQMRDKKVKMITVTWVGILLFLALVLWLSLQRSKGFFLTGSCVATLIFVIIFWAVVQIFFVNKAIVSPCRMNLIVVIVAAALLSIVTLLCIRIGYSTTFYITAASDAAVFLVLSSWVIVRRVADLQKRRAETTDPGSDGEEVHLEYSFLREVAGFPKRFSYKELKEATKNFQTLIGKGGSGSVFKGILRDGLPVAVKRIEGEVRGEKEFHSEIAAILSVQHVNLVRFLGYSLVRRGYRFLVYEFFQNGSLASRIFPGNDGEIFLTWALRYQVAKDVAKALAYLHNDCHFRILHLDVKPENILLDENFRARVSDFGISRLMGKDESRVVTTVRGTRGYLAPEWFSGLGISEKSDVYSYGMVLLELVGGRKNVGFVDDGNISQRTWFYFPKIVSEKMREGKLMEVVDERLLKVGDVNDEELRILVYVALWCIQDKAELRPSMAVVVNMLEGHEAVSMPPETKMFMMDFLPNASEVVSRSSRVPTTTASGIEHPLMSTGSFTASVQIGG